MAGAYDRRQEQEEEENGKQTSQEEHRRRKDSRAGALRDNLTEKIGKDGCGSKSQHGWAGQLLTPRCHYRGRKRV